MAGVSIGCRLDVRRKTWRRGISNGYTAEAPFNFTPMIVGRKLAVSEIGPFIVTDAAFVVAPV